METITNPEIQNLPPIAPQNNNYKILFFVSLGLFLIVSSVLATLLITQKSSKSIQTADIKETEITPTETTKTEAESVTIIPTEIAVTPTKSATTSNVPKDWKTYRNTDYNYSIKYPPTWTVDLQAKNNRGKTIATFLAPGVKNMPHDKIIDIQVSSTADVSRVDSADYIKLSGNKIISTSSIVVGGISIDKFILNLNNGYDMVAYVEKNSETYSLSLHNTTSSDKEYIDNFNLMISTFKFN